MRVGMFGRSGSGRKTLMEALMGPDAQPIPVGRRSVTTIQVKDERIDRLSEIFKPRKTIYSTLEFVLEDSPSDSLKDALNALRAHEVLLAVAKGFEGNSGDVEGAVVEIRDEMVLLDLMLVEKRLESFKKTGDNKSQERLLMDRLKDSLDAGTFLSELELDEGERRLLVPYNLLTLKPLVVAINVRESALGAPEWEDLIRRFLEMGGTAITLCAEVEKEIAKLPVDEQAEFLQGLGIAQPVSQSLVAAVYRALDLISFFTVGEDEVRAWPVRKGSVAPIAAGKVHSDIQRGFIRAETIAYTDFMAVGTIAAGRRNGSLRLEGKDYVVKDGDIINFLFKV